MSYAHYSRHQKPKNISRSNKELQNAERCNLKVDKSVQVKYTKKYHIWLAWNHNIQKFSRECIFCILEKTNLFHNFSCRRNLSGGCRIEIATSIPELKDQMKATSLAKGEKSWYIHMNGRWKVMFDKRPDKINRTLFCEGENLISPRRDENSIGDEVRSALYWLVLEEFNSR